MKDKVSIRKVPVLPFNMVNSFVLTNSSSTILVDAGLPNSEHKVRKVLESVNKSFEDVDLIIVTHAHVDHAGNAHKLKQLTGAPILAHEADLPYYLGKKPMAYCTTSLFAKLFLKSGLPKQKYEPFLPDILLNESTSLFSLDKFGIEGEVFATPGHTCGSISVKVNARDYLVGDLVASGILIGGIAFNSKPTRPPFEDDPAEVSNQLSMMLDRKAETFYMGHGGPLGAKQVRQHISNLSEIAEENAYEKTPKATNFRVETKLIQ